MAGLRPMAAVAWLTLLGVSAPPPQALDVARVAEALGDLETVDIDGRVWRLQDLRGRVVLIDFWATWCAPCRAEIPYLHELTRRYPGDFLVLGISLDRVARREVVRWINQQRVHWPQVHDGRGFGGPLALAFGVEQLPTSILLDREGGVRALSPRREELVAAVERLVAEGSSAADGGRRGRQVSRQTRRPTPTGSAGRRVPRG